MDDAGGVAGEQLRAFVERIERLEEDKAAVASGIGEVYAEAKAAGFAVKIIRQLVRLRRMNKHQRAEEEALLDLYRQAVGMDE